MSCRRARRQLLWLVRFGELGQESAPHLDHLAACRACRDEVGLDRALVRELRTALADRVADAAPSPAVWNGIVARMRQPEPEPAGLRALALRLAGALRAGTAMAGASLALILALNLDVVPVTPAPSPADDAPAAQRPAWAGEIPQFVDVAALASTPAAEPVDDATGSAIGVRAAVAAEELPPTRPAGTEPADAGSDLTESSEETAQGDGWPILAVRLVPSDAARIAASQPAAADSDDEPDPMPARPVQAPS